MTIFYHNDADGHCAAALVALYREEECKNCTSNYEQRFCEMDYNTPFPIEYIKNDEVVYILDYSIDPEDMRKLLAKTENVIWIDHHKTAIEKYNDFGVDIRGIREADGDSGCLLTYKYLLRSRKLMDINGIPSMVTLINDWDTWTHDMYQSRYFIMAFNSKDTQPWNLSFWSHIDDNNYINDMIQDGIVMTRYRDGWAKDVLNHIGSSMDFMGLKVYAVNIPHANSDYFKSIPDSVKEEHDALMPFYYDLNKRVYVASLYSTRPEVDVSIVAKRLGGGGHKNAAGFSTKILPFDISEWSME